MCRNDVNFHITNIIYVNINNNGHSHMYTMVHATQLLNIELVDSAPLTGIHNSQVILELQYLLPKLPNFGIFPG